MLIRRIFLCLLFSLFSFQSFGAQLSFHSYEDGLYIAKRQDKMVYVLFGSDYCSWCMKQKEALSNDEILDVLSKYVMVYVDISEDRSVASKYGVRAVPVSMILDSEGKAVRKNVGYMDKPKFLKWIR